MPFVNIKTPEGALSRQQKEEIAHRTTDMLVRSLPLGSRPPFDPTRSTLAINS